MYPFFEKHGNYLHHLLIKRLLVITLIADELTELYLSQTIMQK